MDSWIRPCRLLAVEGDHLRIGAPNRFSRDWLVQHHLETLQTAAQECVGGQPRVSIIVDDAPPPPPVAHPAPAPPVAVGGRIEGLNPRYTFDSFVVGSSNQFAQAACQAVAELPSRAYNPLFVYGGVGLGKTHLLHAIGHHAARHSQQARVAYVSCEQFTNEYIEGIQNHQLDRFRKKYRQTDVLLIDDVQFLAGKERIQEEFFHTFNALHEARRQIVLTCDRPASELKNLEQRLVSRFEWGL